MGRRLVRTPAALPASSLSSVPRLLRLRRPATIRVLDEPFVPRSASPRLVEERWQAICAANPAFHDGRLLHVLGVHRNGHGGATIHVVECAYRYHAVGLEGMDLGVRPLGVKGITLAPGEDAGASGGARESRGMQVLLGRRSHSVAGCRGRWEFAPGGGLSPGMTAEAALRAELREETGIEADAGVSIRALAVLYDPSVRCWELVHAILLQSPRAPAPQTDEYAALCWRPVASLAGSPLNVIGSRSSSAGAIADWGLDAPLTAAAEAMRALLPTAPRTGGSPHAG